MTQCLCVTASEPISVIHIDGDDDSDEMMQLTDDDSQWHNACVLQHQSRSLWFTLMVMMIVMCVTASEPISVIHIDGDDDSDEMMQLTDDDSQQMRHDSTSATPVSTSLLLLSCMCHILV